MFDLPSGFVTFPLDGLEWATHLSARPVNIRFRGLLATQWAILRSAFAEHHWKEVVWLG